MTQARQMLEHGHLVLQGEFPDTFTVEGDPTVRNGLVQDLVYGNVMTDSGLIQKRAATLLFAFATWTPSVGKRVATRGLTFVVDAIAPTPTRWRVTLVESHVP